MERAVEFSCLLIGTKPKLAETRNLEKKKFRKTVYTESNIYFRKTVYTESNIYFEF